MSDKTTDAQNKPQPVPVTGRRRIFVHDVEMMTRVGVFAVEQRYEQRIILSIDLTVEDGYDGASDRLRDILDYAEIIKRVQGVVEAGHVNLIETLAERISDCCLSFPSVQHVRVRIEKPDILPGYRRVGIEIERSRSPA